MPIPQHFSWPRRVRAWLTWADADQAFGVKPLYRYQIFFRWLLRVNPPYSSESTTLREAPK